MIAKLFLFCILTSLISSLSPSVEDAWYQVKNISLFGQPVQFGATEITFDQDIYLLDAFPCGAFNCTTLRQSLNCIPCDYTHKGCLTRSSQTCTSCNYNLYCDTRRIQWFDLNTTTTITTVPDYGYAHFRYYLADPCESVKFFAEVRSGSCGLYIGYESSIDSTRLFPNRETSLKSADTSQKSLSLALCPGVSYYKTGTVFITVAGVASCSANLHLMSQVMENHDVSAELCDPVLPTHACVIPNYPLLYNDPSDVRLHPYTYMIQGCERITLYTESLQEYAQANIYVSLSDNNTMPKSPNFDYSSDYLWLNGADGFVTFSVCPAEGESSMVIYITVDVLYEGVTFLLSTLPDNFYLVPIESLDPYGGSMSLLGTSSLVSPLRKCTTWVDCGYFWPSVALEPSLPLLRSSYLFESVYPYAALGDVGVHSGQKNRTYSFNVLLTWSSGSSSYTSISESQFRNSLIWISGRVVNSQGEPVNAVVSLAGKEKVAQCDYSSFIDHFSLIQNQIDTIQHINVTGASLDTIYQALAQEYLLDLLAGDERYYYCREDMQTLLITEETPNTETTNVCQHSFALSNGTVNPEWMDDVCCNWPLQWTTQCCVPTQINITTSMPTAVDSSAMSEMCNSPSCTYSYVRDYLDFSLSSQVCPSSTYTKSIVSSRQLWTLNARECKKATFGNESMMSCGKDEDCQGYSCDMIQHRCNYPNAYLEELYLHCVFQFLTPFQQFYFQDKFSLGDDYTIADLASMYRSPDCLTKSQYGLNLPSIQDAPNTAVSSYRSYTSYTLSQYCNTWVTPWWNQPDLDQNFEEGIDTFVCLGVVGYSVTPYRVPSTEETCTQSQFCNHADCTGLNDTECQALCNTIPPSFCALCENDMDCIPFPDIPSTSCNSTSVCLLPNGTIAPHLTQAECSAYGECLDAVCGYSCYSSTGAYDCVKEGVSQSTCNATGGQYINNRCLLSSNSTSDCVSQGGVIQTCADLDAYSCGQCSYAGEACPFDQNKHQCWIQSQPCLTQQACLNTGTCSSDILTLPSYITPYSNVQKSTYGICVTPAMTDFYHSNPASCDQLSYRVGYGCWDPYISISREYCTGMWIEPATMQSQCSQFDACWSSQNYRNYTQDMCISCEDTTTTQWKAPFSWSPGKWTSGEMRGLEWVHSFYGSRNVWTPALDFQQFYLDALVAIQLETLFTVKSETVCRYEHVNAALKTVVCDCFDGPDQAGVCFPDVPVLSSVARACASMASTMTSYSGSLSFAETSVPRDCVDVQISDIAMDQFKIPTAVRLSNNFVSFNEPPAYTVLNSLNAQVGIMQGHGIKLDINNNIDHVIICLKQEEVVYDPTLYPVPAFGVSNEGYSKVYVLDGVNVYLNSSSGDYCAQVTALTSGSYTFFPIQRMADYAHQPQRLLDGTSTSIVYVLGILFIATSVLAIVAVCLSVIDKRLSLWRDLTFVATFCFTFIRGLYFLLLPTVDVSNLVADFLLVVLPTFLYFTAFTLVIILWIVASGMKSINLQGMLRLMRNSFIGVNVALYLFFIAIILAFALSPAPTTAYCGARVAPIQNASDVRQAISIAYSVIIAGVSLVIGLLFLFFGVKIFWALHRGTSHQGVAGRSQLLFGNALIGSGGFILHCVFILIIVVGQVSNIWFSLFGLILTEVVPASALLVMMIGIRTSSKRRGGRGDEEFRSHTKTVTASTMSDSQQSSRTVSRDSQISLRTMTHTETFEEGIELP